MDYASCRSLPAMFFETARAARRQALPLGQARRQLSAAELGARRRRGAPARARPASRSGIGRGDRVALVSENRPEWIIADLAIMSAGAITVPAYVTNTVDDHRHVLGNSGARAVDRLDRGAWPRGCCRRRSKCRASRAVDRDRAGRRRRRERRRSACLGRGAGDAGARRRRHRRARRGARARRHRLPDLHLGHRRRAEGRHAQPPQHPRELPRRLSGAGDARARRRGVPVASCRCRTPTSTPPG